MNKNGPLLKKKKKKFWVKTHFQKYPQKTSLSHEKFRARKNVIFLRESMYLAIDKPSPAPLKAEEIFCWRKLTTLPWALIL